MYQQPKQLTLTFDVPVEITSEPEPELVPEEPPEEPETSFFDIDKVYQPQCQPQQQQELVAQTEPRRDFKIEFAGCVVDIIASQRVVVVNPTRLSEGRNKFRVGNINFIEGHPTLPDGHYLSVRVTKFFDYPEADAAPGAKYYAPSQKSEAVYAVDLMSDKGVTYPNENLDLALVFRKKTWTPEMWQVLSDRQRRYNEVLRMLDVIGVNEPRSWKEIKAEINAETVAIWTRGKQNGWKRPKEK